MNYIQCVLKKSEFDKVLYQTSWIPAKFAILGKFLKLKENNSWDNGWEIISLGSIKKEKELPDSYIDIKQHRKKTGDSLPKKKNPT